MVASHEIASSFRHAPASPSPKNTAITYKLKDSTIKNIVHNHDISTVGEGWKEIESNQAGTRRQEQGKWKRKKTGIRKEVRSKK